MSSHRHINMAIEALEARKHAELAQVRALRLSSTDEVPWYLQQLRSYAAREAEIDDAIAYLRAVAREGLCEHDAGS